MNCFFWKNKSKITTFVPQSQKAEIAQLVEQRIRNA